MSTNSSWHNTAVVETDSIGASTSIGAFTHVAAGAAVGDHVSLGAQCTVHSGACIENHVCIADGVSIPGEITLESHSVIDTHVVFDTGSISNSPEGGISVEQGAHIGSNSIISIGVTVGRGARVAPGSRVTESVPPFAIVSGRPARVIGYVENAASNATQVRELSSHQVSAEQPLPLSDNGAYLAKLKFVADIRGNLSVGEFPRDVPFTPQRYFLIFDVPDEEVRGAHAHKQCAQFLVCVKGSCNVLVDDGECRTQVTLDTPRLGVYLPPMTWGTQFKYSADAVLLVFASHHYDDTDYIRDYETFLDALAE